MGRGAKFWYDNDIEIAFDTFHDGRNAYFFATNFEAVRGDARVKLNYTFRF